MQTIAETAYQQLQQLSPQSQQAALDFIRAMQEKDNSDFEQNTHNQNVTAMAGCLNEYAKPELIAYERELLDSTLTQIFKEKYCADCT